MASGSGKKKGKRPSMKDVAELAGVSKTTISFVINDVPGSNIPPETQERVWDAVRQLDYRPNLMARNLRRKRSHTLGFVSDRVASTPYAGLMIQGAQDAAWENEMILFLVNTNEDPKLETAAVKTMLDRQVEGIIYASWYHRLVKPPREMENIPAVLLDCFDNERSLPSVVPDEVRGGREATEQLLDRGHRRIGFVNNSDPVPATIGRLQGYKDALASYDIPFDESLIWTEVSSSAGGYRGALQLMDAPKPPTALFMYNDRMAMGAYDALRKLDLAIPDDVAVIGFDNHEMIAAHLHPPLSTMELPHYQMGVWAVNHLISESAASDAKRPAQHTLQCSYIERESI